MYFWVEKYSWKYFLQTILVTFWLDLVCIDVKAGWISDKSIKLNLNSILLTTLYEEDFESIQ